MRRYLNTNARVLLVAVFIFCVQNSIGCIPMSVHSGTDLTKLDTFKIVKGTTTEKELIGLFGKPSFTSDTSDGKTTEGWTDGRNDMSVIPLVSVSQKITSRSLNATIQDGIVIDYTIYNGNQKY
jgi:hypothetical protein